VRSLSGPGVSPGVGPSARPALLLGIVLAVPGAVLTAAVLGVPVDALRSVDLEWRAYVGCLAFPAALGCSAAALWLLRHRDVPLLSLPWGRIVGVELACLGGLAAIAAAGGAPDRVPPAAGRVGWALAGPVSSAVGSAAAVALWSACAVTGLAIAAGLPGSARRRRMRSGD